MPPPRNRERMIMITLIGLADFAWSAIGWFGVGMLGLLVLFLALRVEFEGDRPLGTQTKPELDARHSHAERAEPRRRRGSAGGGRIPHRLSPPVRLCRRPACNPRLWMAVFSGQGTAPLERCYICSVACPGHFPPG